MVTHRVQHRTNKHRFARPEAFGNGSDTAMMNHGFYPGQQTPVRQIPGEQDPVVIFKQVSLPFLPSFCHQKAFIGFLQGSLKEFLRSEEHTSELQSLMRISYAVFCLNKKTRHRTL